MFKRSVNFSPYEKDQLLQLIREYIVIFEDKRLDGVGRREKERAWLELTDRYNSLENVNLRTSRQLQACWKNLKNRARDITEACKKGTEFPFFTLASKFNSSYLPSTEEDEAFCFQASVKSEQFSDPDEESKRGSASPIPPGSQGYTIDPSSSPLSSDGSPPTVTNYVYSPTASLPISFVSVPSSLPSVSSASPSASSTTSSRFLPQDHVSASSKLLTQDLGSVTSKFHQQDHVSTSSRLITQDHVSVTSQVHPQDNVSVSSKLLSPDHVPDTTPTTNRVDSIAARLSCSVPSYRPPERSLSKSVERITNSILFERGVSEDLTPQGLFTGLRSDYNSREINGVTLASYKPQDVETVKGNYRSEYSHPSHSKSANKSGEAERIGCSRKYGNSNRPGTLWRPMTSTNPTRVGTNGYVSSRPTGKVTKTVRYKHIEHQARMKNIKYERDCLEAEHRLRCDLLNMKIKYYRKKLDGEL